MPVPARAPRIGATGTINGEKMSLEISVVTKLKRNG